MGTQTKQNIILVSGASWRAPWRRKGLPREENSQGPSDPEVKEKVSGLEELFEESVIEG